MIRKYHNHQLQTDLWHREGEPHNNHETPGRQTKQINQLPLPHRDDCKTRMDTKLRTTKQNNYKIPQWERQLTNQQQQTTDLERTAAKATGGGGRLNAFY